MRARARGKKTHIRESLSHSFPTICARSFRFSRWLSRETKRRRRRRTLVKLLSNSLSDTARTFSRGRGKNLPAGFIFWPLISCIFFFFTIARSTHVQQSRRNGWGRSAREQKDNRTLKEEKDIGRRGRTRAMIARVKTQQPHNVSHCLLLSRSSSS